MSLLSQDVAGAAPAHAVDGVTFQHFGLPQLAEFERRRYATERDRLRLLREDYPAAVYVERLDMLRERYERHEFAFENDESFRQSPAGVMLIMEVMTGRSNQEVYDLLLAHPDETRQVMELVIRESFPKLTPAATGGSEPAAP